MPRKNSPLYIALIMAATMAFSGMIATPAQSFSFFPFFSKKSTPLPPQDKYKGQALALDKNIHRLAGELFANLNEADPEAGNLMDGVIMGSFVDLKKLSRTSSFGRYLAEQLMTEFQQHGYKVVEVRKSTSVIIQKNRGEYGLSRDASQIKPNVAARTMVTGTYTIAGDEIMVNAKVLDNKNADLLSSSTILFPRNALADLLLSDAASASSGKNSVTYMKKLEL
ncbi:MAG: hypothetical protein GXP59_08705 [Deltaproteobacteria bacterium]|nr:hypothetical protein [Deltaproteobacteria bacterium]